MKRVEITEMVGAAKRDECWPWPGRIDKDGYGRVGPQLAHRRAYEDLVGPIPDGLVIDHLCRNRSCVNPGHMEPVPPAVNTWRGVGISTFYAARTHCKHGHEYTPENTRVRNGIRRCRACDRIRQAQVKARRAVSR